MNRRIEHWPSALHALIEARKNEPFAWGSHDCCMFAGDCAREIVGVDLFAQYRGEYSTALGAARIWSREGGVEALIEKACDAAEFPPVPVLMAQRGDLVLFDTERGPALGICLGAESWFTGLDGLTSIHTHQCRKAWRVGA